MINLRSYVGASTSRLLVMVDLQTRGCDELAQDNPQDLARVLDNCSAAIRHARANGIPIAFTRPCKTLGLVERGVQSPWLQGLEPKRADMVFERQHPSCYGNSLFSDVVSRIESFAIGGLGAEEICLATAIDAAHRGHHVTFLSDASASRQRPHADACTVHGVATSAVELFADVATTSRWLVATAPRPVRGHVWMS
ncbi:cysteine hydrolase family protein [Bradyrhizobium lablabi]|uniref:cysteine hydrolase family protein n=1 Tax=Bradyrhizobium lablabi TaxID=722472 RepID=UPI001BAAC616|nr:isochorismatase family protein [Bradyrhizobium lablabi]